MKHFIPFDDRSTYITTTVDALQKRWSNAQGNNSRVRAVFRRWRPAADGAPTLDMRSLVWECGPVPGELHEGKMPTEEQLALVDQAATIVALRAIAGDTSGRPVLFGAALYQAKLTDHRLMRLLTTPPNSRLESLMRAFQRINRENVPVYWSPEEIKRLINFLFGDADAAQQSINAWASAFFRERDRSNTKKGTTSGDTDTASDRQNQPSTIEE